MEKEYVEEQQSHEIIEVDESYEEEEDGEYENDEEEFEDDHELELEDGEDDENDSFVQAQIKEYKKNQGLLPAQRKGKTSSTKKADLKKQEPEYFPYSNRGKLSVTQKIQKEQGFNQNGLGFFSDSQSEDN